METKGQRKGKPKKKRDKVKKDGDKLKKKRGKSIISLHLTSLQHPREYFTENLKLWFLELQILIWLNVLSLWFSKYTQFLNGFNGSIFHGNYIEISFCLTTYYIQYITYIICTFLKFTLKYTYLDFFMEPFLQNSLWWTNALVL